VTESPDLPSQVIAAARDATVTVDAARVEATTADGSVVPLAMSPGLLNGAGTTPAGVVAVLRRADADLVPFLRPQP
jgi:hypothetical protein